MREFVMRHPKLPGQPIVVNAHDESDLTVQEAAGWKVAKTKAEDLPAVPTSEPAEPVNNKEN